MARNDIDFLGPLVEKAPRGPGPKVRRIRQGDTNTPTVPPWKWEPRVGVPIGRLKQAYEAVLSTTDAFAEKRAEVAKRVASDRRLSDEGKREQILATAKDDFLRPIRRARHEIARAKEEIEHRRAALKPKAVDPLDFAGALMRQELRQHLYDMGKEAGTFLMTTSDTRFLEAALTAPRELSGVNPEIYKAVEARAVEIMFPEQAAAVAEAEEALAAAERTLEVAEGHTLNEMGGDARVWAAEVAQEIDPGELQKTEQERAKRKAASQPVPTREELREMAKRMPLKEREALRSEIWDDTTTDVIAGFDRALESIRGA